MSNAFWNIDRIRIGFEKFYKENGRLPTALEVDKIDYLPSSRQIQRLFGGLPNLRKALGYADTHFGKGENRSKIGFAAHKASRISEKNLETLLIQYFHEVFVHIEKPVSGSKIRLDFYIYNQTKNFGIDIFTTENIHTLRSNLTVKAKKYTTFNELLYLVVDSSALTQQDIEEYHLGKVGIDLPSAKLITLNEFLLEMKQYIPYSNPIKEIYAK